MGNKFAYTRPLTENECLSRQVCGLKEFGVSDEYVFLDEKYGDFSQYEKMKSELRQGDILYIKSLKVLGRTPKEILERWKYISKDVNATIKVINMFMMDTSKWIEALEKEEMLQNMVE